MANALAPRTGASDGADAAKEIKGAGFGPMYNVMRFIGERSAAHFFRRVEVIGGHDVPKDGPFILCCTHFSTIMDVAIISAELPHRRPIHYWAKRGLYKRQPFRWILHSSGNIQVDRKTKNNQDLFAGTFKAMEAGEAIGLFPEGGSYTEHRLHSMKAGAAWAALEYAKHMGSDKTKVTIVPASINYTDKSRFRSEAVFQFGPAFSVDEYTQEFLSDAQVAAEVAARKDFPFDVQPRDPLASVPHTPGPSIIVSGDNGPHPETRMRLGLDIGDQSRNGSALQTPLDPNGPTLDRAETNGVSLLQTPSSTVSKAPSSSSGARAAVKKLTDRIGAEIYKLTIDAPDWATWHGIKMARELIWSRGGSVPLRDLVPISNAIVTILNLDTPESRKAKEALLTLQAMVIASSTDVYTLNALEKAFGRRSSPRSTSILALIPTGQEAAQALPSLKLSLLYFGEQLLWLLVRLPYVLPLALVYVPAYAVGWGLSLRYASHEEESMASAKSLCAFVIAALTHGLVIFVVAALMLFTPPGWLLGLGVSYAIEKLHVWLLNESYDRIKKLVASIRVLLAVIGVRSGVMPQRGSEDEAVRLAREILYDRPAIQWSYIETLRMGGLGAGDSAGEKEERRNKPMERPAIASVMGAAIESRKRAQIALAELLATDQVRASTLSNYLPPVRK